MTTFRSVPSSILGQLLRAAACACLVFAACATDGAADETDQPLTPDPEAQSHLETARAQFAMLHGSYRFTSEIGCNCPEEYTQPIRIDVVNDAISSALYAATNQPVSPQVQGTLLTIEQVFTKIEKAIASNAFRIEVAYDVELGFPTHVFIDQSEQVADDTFAIDLSDVMAL